MKTDTDINNQSSNHQPSSHLCVCVCLTVVLGVAQTQPQVVKVLQDLFQGQLGQFTAGAAETDDGNTAATDGLDLSQSPPQPRPGYYCSVSLSLPAHCVFVCVCTSVSCVAGCCS